MNIEKELKSCPFCGNTYVVLGTSKELHGDGSDYEYAVCCDINNKGCGACSGYYTDKEKAINKWNKRV